MGTNLLTKMYLILSTSILIAGVWLFIMVGLFGVFFIPFRLL